MIRRILEDLGDPPMPQLRELLFVVVLVLFVFLATTLVDVR